MNEHESTQVRAAIEHLKAATLWVKHIDQLTWQRKQIAAALDHLHEALASTPHPAGE